MSKTVMKIHAPLTREPTAAEVFEGLLIMASTYPTPLAGNIVTEAGEALRVIMKAVDAGNMVLKSLKQQEQEIVADLKAKGIKVEVDTRSFKERLNAEVDTYSSDPKAVQYV